MIKDQLVLSSDSDRLLINPQFHIAWERANKFIEPANDCHSFILRQLYYYSEEGCNYRELMYLAKDAQLFSDSPSEEDWTRLNDALRELSLTENPLIFLSGDDYYYLTADGTATARLMYEDGEHRIKH